MKTYLLEKEIIIKAPIEEVWHFFSKPQNLIKITPSYMNFRIVQCPETIEIYDGMEIRYQVSPVLKIPMRWVTRIQHVEVNKTFTDIQLSGPYALWQHTHNFESTAEGTRMKDYLQYALPLGILGQFAHGLFVRKQLEDIFNYRKKVIANLF